MKKIGIVGLPNVGKSSLFKLITKNEVEIAAYPFTTIRPSIGFAKIPDSRLTKLEEIIKPEITTSSLLEFVDIAGLVKGASKGEGLGNEFLSYIRPVSLIIEVIRAFETQDSSHIYGTIDIKRDIEIIKEEFRLKDEELKERRKKSKKNIAIFELLSQKPIFYLINYSNHSLKDKNGTKESLRSLGIGEEDFLFMNVKEELDLLELKEEERRDLGFEKSYLANLIVHCYNKLGLISFFTCKGGRELRSYSLEKGNKIVQAAELVHSDFKEKFVRAKVINFKDFIKEHSFQNSKIVGRDHLVNDGDIIEFVIS